MIENLIPLLGKSIESPEIKDLLTDWRVPYPTKITCSESEPDLKVKIEKDCIRLYFNSGVNIPHLEPIPTRFKGGYVALFTKIGITKKRKGGIPFGVEFDTSPEMLTSILGEPNTTNDVVEMTIWCKNITDKHEFVVTDTLLKDGNLNRTMIIRFSSNKFYE